LHQNSAHYKNLVLKGPTVTGGGGLKNGAPQYV